MKNNSSNPIGSSTRYFNKIDRVSFRYVKKTSTYSSKFLDEVLWFSKLPKDLIPFVPKIKNISTAKNNISITYKYLKTPTLHIRLMNNYANECFWENVKCLYNDFFQKCRAIKPASFDDNYWFVQAEGMYITKTIERLLDVLSDPQMDFFYCKKNVTINGKKYPSLITIIDFLKKAVKTKYRGAEYKLLKEIVHLNKDNVCFIHGDLVFSNVFACSSCFCKSKKLKFIDPRGCFWNDKNFGDILYDYSKIYQCVFGSYDFIINNQFTTKLKNDNFEYTIKTNDALSICQKKFDDLFSNKSLNKIKLIEALQFLSMASLHSDKKEHEFIILAHGIVRFCNIVNKKIWK